MDIGLTNSSLCHTPPCISALANRPQVGTPEPVASQAHKIPFLGKMMKWELSLKSREILKTS